MGILATGIPMQTITRSDDAQNRSAIPPRHLGAVNDQRLLLKN